MAMKIKRSDKKFSGSSSSCSMPGVWHAVSNCEGIAVIFHSPKACSHVTASMDTSSYFRNYGRKTFETVPLISSLLNQKHSIFGGEDQLRKCIDYTIETYKPKCIVIANSCLAGVIGDDIFLVAQKAEEKYNIPIIATKGSGFLDGEYYGGYLETTKIFIERFMTKQAIEKNSVFLIGDYGGPESYYAKDLKKILNLFGLNVNGQFPTYTRFSDLNKVATSSLNIVLGGRKKVETITEKIAFLLNNKLGTPYYTGTYPLGWSNTVRWIEGLGEYLNKQDKAKSIIKELGHYRKEKINGMVIKLKGKKLAMCIGRRVDYFQPRWVIETLETLGCEFLGIILIDSYEGNEKEKMIAEIKKWTDVPIYNENEKNSILDDSDLVLTTHELVMPEKRQFFIPMIPPMAITEEIKFIEKMTRILYRHGSKGGIAYGW